MTPTTAAKPGLVPRRAERVAKDEFPIHPLAGIVSTIITIYLAVLAVPEDPEPKGAMVWPGLIMALGLAVVPLAMTFKSFKTILRGEHLLVLAPIYWLLLDLIQGAYDLEQVSTDEAKTAFVAIGLFVVGVWVAAFRRPWRLPDTLVQTASYDIRANAFFAIVVMSFFLGIFKYAEPCRFNPMEMFFYLGQPRWDAPWNRGAMGGWDAFQDHMQYFGYLLPAFAVVMAGKVGWLNLRTLVTVALSMFMAVFLAQEGGRRTIGVVFGMAIILWVLSQKRLGTKGVVIVATCATLLLFVMQTMLEYRNIGLAAMFAEDVEVQKREYIHVDDNFLRLCQSIQLVPSQYPHTHFHYFFYVLVRPVPRALWPGKPTAPGFNLPDALDLKGVSLSSSVIGELYVAGGFAVILLGGWFYGRMAGMASRLLQQTGRLGAYIVYSTWMMALFAGVRSMLDLILISYVILAWVALCWLYRFFHTRREIKARPLNA